MAEVHAEVFRRADGKWAWRAIAANNQTVASDAGQGYENRADAETMMRSLLGGEYAAAVGRMLVPMPEPEHLIPVVEAALRDALAGDRNRVATDLNMVARFVTGKIRDFLYENGDSSRQE